jgi:hypothetical protein
MMALLTAVVVLGGRQAAATESSLGVELGYVKAKAVDSTLFFAGDYRFHLTDNFGLAPEFSYWKRSQTSLGLSASLEDLQFGVKAVGVYRASRTLELFAAGGGGLHHFTGNAGVSGGTAISDSQTKGGLNVSGGLDLKAGDNLSFFMAARYDWVLGLEGDDKSRLDQKKFSGGFRVRF